MKNARIRLSIVAAAALALSAALAGCASQEIGLRRVSLQQAYSEEQTSALSTYDISDTTRIVLRRFDLSELYDEFPDRAIDALRERFNAAQNPRLALYALAELSYLEGERASVEAQPRWTARRAGESFDPAKRPAKDPIALARARTQFLTAALYAYAFLFPEADVEELAIIDPRVRIAADLYNRAVALAFTRNDGIVDLNAGNYDLPFGDLNVTLDPSELEWADHNLADFVALESFSIVGLTNHYRTPGLGASLGARAYPIASIAGEASIVNDKVMVPATALLRFDSPLRTLRTGRGDARLELYTVTEGLETKIGDATVPIEANMSAAFAGTMENTKFWEDQLALFLGKALLPNRKSQLFAGRPHQRGRIPVVFVHGTNSHPAVWANMINDLASDPVLRDHYEAWLFRYDSGNPILYSSMKLRDALTAVVDQLDPEQTDDCLRQMVVIGHSQGGLLTKMTVVRSGNVFWDNISSKPFAAAKMSDETRTLLEKAIFIEPLPFVKRVVFVATPHRGSFLAGPQFVRRLAGWLIRLPGDMLGLAADMATFRDSPESKLGQERLATATSIDNMSPGHPFIRASATLPIVDEVTAHSIIAVKPGDEIESGDDTVVKYQSAHIEGVQSELVVRSTHSCQSNPNTVEEVRRILREHAAGSRCGPHRVETGLEY